MEPMYLSEEDIYQKVKETLVEALGVEEADVRPGAKITADLGAESIDFLDIVFRLEKALNIKIPRGELFPDNVLNNPQFVQDGRLTPAGLETLKERMPHVDFTEFEDNPDISRMGDLFTVQTIVNYVQRKVNG
jgi:acyl carrier protein